MAEKILKPHVVTIEYTAVVMAENPADAYSVASMHEREITSDEQADISTGHEISSEDALSAYGWNGTCLPYGGDGHSTLREIFAALDALPTRDTKTADMFSEPSGS